MLASYRLRLHARVKEVQLISEVVLSWNDLALESHRRALGRNISRLCRKYLRYFAPEGPDLEYIGILDWSSSTAFLSIKPEGPEDRRSCNPNGLEGNFASRTNAPAKPKYELSGIEIRNRLEISSRVKCGRVCVVLCVSRNSPKEISRHGEH